MRETELVDIATGAKKMGWIARRRLSQTERASLTETQALLAELSHLSDEAPPELPNFAAEAARLPRKHTLLRKQMLPSLALFAFLTVLLLPQTHSLVKAQVTLVLGGTSRLLNPVATPTSTATYRVQLGSALTAPDSRPKLRELITHYPDRPELRAWALRSATERPLLAADLNQAISDAEAGERLAPENALFPLLKSTAYLAAGKDDEAVQAVQAAVQAPHWDEYRESIFGAIAEGLRSRNQGLGGSSLLAQQAGLHAEFNSDYRHAIIFPTQLIVKRIHALEQAGQPRQAQALRDALFSLGSHIQRDATNSDDSYYGATMALASLSLPSTPRRFVDSTPFSYSKEDWQRAAEKLLVDYRIEAHKHGQEPNLSAQAAVIRRQVARESLRLDFTFRSLPELAYWWGGLLPLVWILWLVLCGGLAYLLNRTERVRERRALHPAIGWGVPLALLLPFLIAMSVFDLSPYGSFYAVLFLLALSGCGIHLKTTQRGSATFGGNVGVLLLTALITLGFLGVAGYLLAGSAFFGSSPAPGNAKLATYGVIAGFLALSLPMGLAGWFALASYRRLPASVGIVRGFRRNAVPIACGLLILYAALTPFIAAKDNERGRELSRYLQHEGRYSAWVQGKPWP